MSAGRMRRSSDVSLLANETIEEGSVVVATNTAGLSSSHHSIEGALLSDFAKREFLSSRESMDAVDSKEALIRKQAEKIASLEARLAHMDMNGDDIKSLSSRGGGSAGSHRLTAEERLRIHRERKMQEEKYKEQAGKWDAPPKRKEKNIANKVKENDDLVLKLTSDPSFRRKIDEEEKSKKSGRKSLPRDRSPSISHNSHPSSNRKHLKQNGRADIEASTSGSERDFIRQKSPIKIRCDTCGSTRDCEEDVDNPGTYYCKPCWEEYENEVHAAKPDVSSRPPQDTRTEATTSEVSHALWIAHDNPQLGEKIICSGPRRMECMLETKEPGKKDCVRMIIGDIDYSGKVQKSGIGNTHGVESEQGTECIRIRNARGYYVDHNQVATRLSRDKTIYEFQLGDDSAEILTGKNATISVEEFFKDCRGAIDVILDPQRDAGGWYPQKEARSGGRKIAPQFRSKGVGYIRLGDDMSENGLAFLSVNACATFLSSIAKTVTSASKSASFSKPKPTNKVAAARKVMSHRSVRPPVETSSPPDDSDEESVEDESQNALEILKQLQSADMDSSMKWKDKADLISKLGKGASRQEWSHVRPQALQILQDTLGGKNTNVHVVRSALIAAGMIGISMGGELVSQNSWKTIMIETMKLLKSKQCGTVAKTVLAQLHGRCFTLANSLEMVTHVLGLGSVATASKSRTRSVTETPKPRRVSAITPNNIEVVEWLADTTERERNLEVIDPMLDTTSLNVLIDLFLSHADHRDQRCRKSASDGLVHCILYGVKSLGMELTRVVRMISGLKESNPRMWNSIVQSAQRVLEDER